MEGVGEAEGQSSPVEGRGPLGERDVVEGGGRYGVRVVVRVEVPIGPALEEAGLQWESVMCCRTDCGGRFIASP